MGYSILEDESAPNRKAFESVDTYLGRVEGLMMLYGAVVQVSGTQASVHMKSKRYCKLPNVEVLA